MNETFVSPKNGYRTYNTIEELLEDYDAYEIMTIEGEQWNFTIAYSPRHDNVLLIKWSKKNPPLIRAPLAFRREDFYEFMRFMFGKYRKIRRRIEELRYGCEYE